MKATKAQIDEFLVQPHIALAGYSMKKNKFGTTVYNTLKEKGLNLYPVNPAGGQTPEGEPVYENLSALPNQVKALYIVTKPEVTQELVSEAIEKGFTHIWVQQMSDNKMVKEQLKELPNSVTGQCILMHANPAGFHKFHWWLVKFFGKLPA